MRKALNRDKLRAERGWSTELESDHAGELRRIFKGRTADEIKILVKRIEFATAEYFELVFESFTRKVETKRTEERSYNPLNKAISEIKLYLDGFLTKETLEKRVGKESVEGLFNSLGEIEKMVKHSITLQATFENPYSPKSLRQTLAFEIAMIGVDGGVTISKRSGRLQALLEAAYSMLGSDAIVDVRPDMRFIIEMFREFDAQNMEYVGGGIFEPKNSHQNSLMELIKFK